MAIVRNPTEADSPLSYVVTLAFFCCVSCVVLMMRFRGFRASLNFGSKPKDTEEELAPTDSIIGSYRINRDELQTNGSLSDAPKRLTPSMVKLPQSSNEQALRPTKSTSDLMARAPPAPQSPQHRSTHNVSMDPRGAPSTSQHTNLAPAPLPPEKKRKDAKNQKEAKNKKEVKNQKDAKNQNVVRSQKEAERVQKNLEEQMEKRRLVQLKEKEKEQARREKLKRDKEKKEAQERAKAEKMNKKKPAPQAKAANPLANVQAPGPAPAPGPSTRPGPPTRQAPAPVAQPPKQSPAPAAQPQPASYSTNTLESSISKSSGPPPYADLTTEPQNSNPTNVTFGKPIDKAGDSWDLVSQHRQQLGRPVSSGLPRGPQKTRVMDLQYKLGGSENDSNSEV